MATTTPRPDLAAHVKATRASFPEVAGELSELLGARLVAYLGGVKETRAVRQWAQAEREPSEEVRVRLRMALQVAAMIAQADGAAVTQSWFQGLNPQLGDRSPARLLRDGDLNDVGPDVLGAARAFLVGG
jgi:hypothetical protein